MTLRVEIAQSYHGQFLGNSSWRCEACLSPVQRASKSIVRYKGLSVSTPLPKRGGLVFLFGKHDVIVATFGILKIRTACGASISSEVDPCRFWMHRQENVVAIIVVYIDGLLLLSATKMDKQRALEDPRSTASRTWGRSRDT